MWRTRDLDRHFGGPADAFLHQCGAADPGLLYAGTDQARWSIVRWRPLAIAKQCLAWVNDLLVYNARNPATGTRIVDLDDVSRAGLPWRWPSATRLFTPATAMRWLCQNKDCLPAETPLARTTRRAVLIMWSEPMAAAKSFSVRDLRSIGAQVLSRDATSPWP